MLLIIGVEMQSRPFYAEFVVKVSDSENSKILEYEEKINEIAINYYKKLVGIGKFIGLTYNVSYDEEELEFIVNVEGFKIQDAHHLALEDEIKKSINNNELNVELFVGVSGWED